VKHPGYPRTKPSGVEWLGDVPEHWDVKSLTRVTISIRNGTSATQLEDDSESSVPVTRIESISGGRINFDKVGQVEWTPTLENFRLKKGDILLSHINSLSMVGNCAIFDSDRPLYSGMNLLRIQPEPTVHAPWLWRVLSGDGVRKEVSARAKPAINQASVTTTQIKALQLPVPPVSEQRAIAAFLDRETGRVDRLVAKKRELIERLKEKRTALIARTVTRGLPPAAARVAGLPVNSPLKPSGNVWLDDIPTHWDVKRIKEVSILVGRIGFRGYSTDDLVYEGEGAISMSPSNMADGVVSLDKCTWLSWEKYHESPEIKVEAGDVIMVKTGSTIGKTAFVDVVPIPMTINPQLMIFKKVKCSKRFFFYYLFSKVIQDVIPLHNTGSTIPTMTQEGIGKLAFPHPPLPEQAAIAAYLDEEMAKLAALVSKAEAAVERLQEYRTALITAAVTGKIDVRGSVDVRPGKKVTSASP
jgi:type I restriction enzyme S subunit